MKGSSRYIAAPAAALIVASAGLAQQATQPQTRPGGAQDQRQLDRDRIEQRPLLGERAQQGQNPWGAVARGGDVIGATIIDSTNENIGSISDLVIDPKTSHVAYAILSHGGFLGIGAQQVAIPWQLIQARPDLDRTYQVNMTQDRLEQAPSFEDDQWPILATPGWFDSTDKFFGTTPQRDRTRGTGGWGMQGRIQQHWNQGEQTTILGTITAIDRQSPQEGVEEGLVVTVQTGDGQDRLVHLGPSWYLEGQLAELEEGKQVQIKAREIALEDRAVVLAESIQFDRGMLALRDEQGRPTWDAMQRDQRILAVPEDRDFDDDRQPGRDPVRPGIQPGEHPGQPGHDQPRDPAQPGARPGQDPGMAHPGQQPGQTADVFVRGSDMRGKNVRNRNQENVGKVNELAIDVSTGRVPFVIAGFGGFLGMGETEVVLPWQALTFMITEGMYMLAVDEQQLKTAPTLERDQLVRLEDPAFRQEVYSHFGMDPAFATYETGTMPSIEQRQAWGSEGQIQQRFQQGEQVEIRGTISNITQGEVIPGSAQAVVVTIRDQQGEEHNVKLGPSWFLQRQDMTLRTGEEIAIEGRKIDMDGQQVILAQSARTTQAGLWLRDEQGRPRWDALRPGERHMGIDEQPDDKPDRPQDEPDLPPPSGGN
jgi:sporulation protein YlmC with PRC-barrel domain